MTFSYPEHSYNTFFATESLSLIYKNGNKIYLLLEEEREARCIFETEEELLYAKLADNGTLAYWNIRESSGEEVIYLYDNGNVEELCRGDDAHVYSMDMNGGTEMLIFSVRTGKMWFKVPGEKVHLTETGLDCLPDFQYGTDLKIKNSTWRDMDYYIAEVSEYPTVPDLYKIYPDGRTVLLAEAVHFSAVSGETIAWDDYSGLYLGTIGEEGIENVRRIGDRGTYISIEGNYVYFTNNEHHITIGDMSSVEVYDLYRLDIRGGEAELISQNAVSMGAIGFSSDNDIAVFEECDGEMRRMIVYPAGKEPIEVDQIAVEGNCNNRFYIESYSDLENIVYVKSIYENGLLCTESLISFNALTGEKRVLTEE